MSTIPELKYRIAKKQKELKQLEDDLNQMNNTVIHGMSLAYNGCKEAGAICRIYMRRNKNGDDVWHIFGPNIYKNHSLSKGMSKEELYRGLKKYWLTTLGLWK